MTPRRPPRLPRNPSPRPGTRLVTPRPADTARRGMGLLHPLGPVRQGTGSGLQEGVQIYSLLLRAGSGNGVVGRSEIPSGSLFITSVNVSSTPSYEGSEVLRTSKPKIFEVGSVIVLIQ